MKLPKIFIPNKNLDENIEEMLKTEKILKHREIEDVFSLLNLPEDIQGYSTNYKKIEDKKIPAYAWCNHFGSLFPPYLIEAGETMYFKRAYNFHHNVAVYSLNFSSDSELNELIRKSDVTKEFINPKYEDWTIKCLKKENYMIAILINKELINDLKFFKNWYVDNFGVVEI